MSPPCSLRLTALVRITPPLPGRSETFTLSLDRTPRGSSWEVAEGAKALVDRCRAARVVVPTRAARPFGISPLMIPNDHGARPGYGRAPRRDGRHER